MADPADVLEVTPAAGPVDGTVRVPGSKSLTNRALVCAALAAGHSTLAGALRADDTEAMVDGLGRLGISATWSVPPGGDRVDVDGRGGELPAAVPVPGEVPGGDPAVAVDARLSGTTSRFLLPVLALGRAPVRLDGAPGLRARPMADGIAALRALGAAVHEEGEPGHLPVTVRGPEAAPPAGRARLEVSGEASSQFLSGLLLAAPVRPGGLHVAAGGRLVSRPYVDMTVAVMRSFGAEAGEGRSGGGTWDVAPTGYRATDHRIEPDASAAAYFFAAAAVLGGRVTVEGLGHTSLQGDLAFVDVLARMGCEIHRDAGATTVIGTGRLRGVEADLGDLSDTAPTLAAVAAFADGPTRVRGIGFIRHKETDRVGNVVAELRRCGIGAEEEPDGFLVHPGTPRPAVVRTYDDHRMAMSFALLGLRAPGIVISDPGCVGKTFPGFWEALAGLTKVTRS